MERIRVRVSTATRQKLDAFARSRGLRTSFVVEQAVLSFIESRTELGDEAVIPARIVLGNAAFDKLVKLLKWPPKPNRALVELMRGRAAGPL